MEATIRHAELVDYEALHPIFGGSRGLNTTWAIVGLISAVVLVIISPNVFTGPNSEPPATPIITIDSLFPLKSPAIISVPLGFPTLVYDRFAIRGTRQERACRQDGDDP